MEGWFPAYPSMLVRNRSIRVRPIFLGPRVSLRSMRIDSSLKLRQEVLGCCGRRAMLPEHRGAEPSFDLLSVEGLLGSCVAVMACLRGSNLGDTWFTWFTCWFTWFTWWFHHLPGEIHLFALKGHLCTQGNQLAGIQGEPV